MMVSKLTVIQPFTSGYIPKPNKEGLMVIGKLYTNDSYDVTETAPVMTDELLVFDQKLNEEQISLLSSISP